MYSFEIKCSKDLLKKVIEDFNDYKEEQTSSRIAINCAMSAWHLTDWVFKEYKVKHGFQEIGIFRSSLNSPSLGLMHDVANGAKHLSLSNPKTDIVDSGLNEGDFAFEDFAREDFNVSRLVLRMQDGAILDFYEEVEKCIVFWSEYLSRLDP